MPMASQSLCSQSAMGKMRKTDESRV